MKIAQIICTFPPYKGGMGNVANSYANILTDRGHSVTVITPAYTKKTTHPSSSFKVDYKRPLIKYGNAAFLPQTFSSLNDFDVVHFHYPFFGTDIALFFALLFCKKKYKLIIHYHMDVTGLPFYMKPFSWPSKIILRYILKRADLITCASLDYVANSQIKKAYKKKSSKFKEIVFGVDASVFKPSENVKENDNTILFVGGLDKAHYFKGLDRFLRVLKKLEKKEWNLKIVGYGDREEFFKKQAEDLGILSRVEFLGNVELEKLTDIYRQADFFVLPSINRNEAFGIVLLEAMSSGVAVLASDLFGVRKVFENNVQGKYFKAKDETDLLSKISWFLDNKEEVKKMGEKGRKLVKNKYAKEIVSEKLVTIYENLLNK